MSKRFGRRDFQIDLGLWLIGYGIEEDWKYPNKRPKWMRKKEFLPCNCKSCYFCKNKHTDGIYPNRAKMLFTPPEPTKKRKKNVTVRCCNTQYVLKEKKSYCRMCYVNHPENIKTTVNKDKRKTKKYCNQTNLGCPSCCEPICNECWPQYVTNGHIKVPK